MPLAAADIAAIIASHPNKATATLPTLATIDGYFVNPSKNAAIFNATVNGTDPLFCCSLAESVTNGLDISSYLTIGEQEYIIVNKDAGNDGFVRFALTKDNG